MFSCCFSVCSSASSWGSKARYRCCGVEVTVMAHPGKKFPSRLWAKLWGTENTCTGKEMESNGFQLLLPFSLFHCWSTSLIFVFREVLGSFNPSNFFLQKDGVGMVERILARKSPGRGPSYSLQVRHLEGLDFPRTLPKAQRGNWGPDRTMEFWVVEAMPNPLPYLAPLPHHVLHRDLPKGPPGTNSSQNPWCQE